MNKYEETFLDLINFIDFELRKDKDGFWLYDLQGANLGDIESDRFQDAWGIIDRVEIYLDDYIIGNFTDDCITLKKPLDLNELSKLDDYRGLSDYEMILVYLEHNLPKCWAIPYLDLICRNFDKVNLNNLNIEED